MSIAGDRKLFTCPSCRSRFFFWRPDELPGAKVKCYFCRHEFEDDAAQRTPPKLPEPPPAPAPAA